MGQGILEFVQWECLSRKGMANTEYTIRIQGRQVVLRSREVEPYVAGLLAGMRDQGGSAHEWEEELYREDDPTSGGRRTAFGRPMSKQPAAVDWATPELE